MDSMIELSKESIIVLALESWRLSRVIEKLDSDSLQLHFPIRKLKECLESEGCTYIDLTGQIYDSGMAVDILDVEQDPNQSSSTTIIKEMITPIIIWKQEVIHHGQVIVRKGTLIEEIFHE